MGTKTACLVDLMQVISCHSSSPSLSLSEMNDSVNENSDTVGQIVHYIMKNEGLALSVSGTIQYSYVLLKTCFLEPGFVWTPL